MTCDLEPVVPPAPNDERNVGYIIFVRSRAFESWAHLNQLADQWLRENADQRVHGTRPRSRRRAVCARRRCRRNGMTRRTGNCGRRAVTPTFEFLDGGGDLRRRAARGGARATAAAA
jgi:hypothetical protein